MEYVYVASRTKREKIIVLAYSTFLSVCSVWWLFGGLTVAAVCAILLVAASICETFLQKLAFTDSALIYTNAFGKKRELPYSKVASMRYVAGSELAITTVDGSRIRATYGDFARMITIIGDKTNRKPPLEIAELSLRLPGWFGSLRDTQQDGPPKPPR